MEKLGGKDISAGETAGVFKGFVFKKLGCCPDLCGSVGWAPSPKATGRWFDSPAGHMPGFWVWSQVRDI